MHHEGVGSGIVALNAIEHKQLYYYKVPGAHAARRWYHHAKGAEYEYRKRGNQAKVFAKGECLENQIYGIEIYEIDEERMEEELPTLV